MILHRRAYAKLLRHLIYSQLESQTLETKTVRYSMEYATITSLPTETLSSIFEHFCLHCRHGDTEGPDSYFRSPDHHKPQETHERSWYLADYRQPLVSLCLVSRRFRDVAQQVLHHEFVLGYGDSWRSTPSSWDRRLTSFLRTVGRRPDLAVSVKRVSLHPKLLEAAELDDVGAVVDLRRMGRGLGLELDEWMPPCYQGRPGQTRGPKAWTHRRDSFGRSRCRKGAEMSRVVHVDEHTITESFQKRHALGLELLAILIGLLPSVERLSIQQTVVDYNTPYLSCLRSMTTIVGARLLKTLDLATHDHSPELMIKVPSQAAGIFELAKDTVQTLNLHMCNGFWSEPEEAPTFRSLKTLRLTQSHLSAAALSVLLSACTSGLTTFTYEAARTCVNLDSRPFHLPDAVDSLRPHRRTLKALHLDLRQIVEKEPVQPFPPAGLADFTVLEDLFLSLHTLWTRKQMAPGDEANSTRLLGQLVPASVTSLGITGAKQDRRWRRLPAVLLGLARAVADEGKLAGLRQVRCDSMWKRRLDKGLGPEIGSIFEGAGVEFGFSSWPLSQETVAKEDVPENLRLGRDQFVLEDFDSDEYELEEAEREEAEREEIDHEGAGRKEIERSS